MEAAGNDVYKTLAAASEAVFKDRSSRFLAFGYLVSDTEQVRQHLDALRKKYYDATHHCYAYRLKCDGSVFRANDDGEPSGTAGRPILGQMMSMGVTECLVVVVRYFGGIKLGVPGLINAYRESTAAVLGCADIIEKTADTRFDIIFPYMSMNDVMKVVKEEQPRIVNQQFDNLCAMTLAIRRSRAGRLGDRLEKVEGVQIERKEEEE